MDFVRSTSVPGTFPKASRLALIVDDDEDASALLSRLLQLHGFRVLTATHGRDALTWLDDASVLPSIILLDMDMPVMDGRRFLVHRAQRDWRAVPVIVVSGSVDLEQRVEGFDVDIHRKPVRPTRLVAQIEMALRSGDSRRASDDPVAGDGVLEKGPSPEVTAGGAMASSAMMAVDAGAAPTEPPSEASVPEPPDPASVPDPISHG
jgi:DNA-binding response OmpR family regulator